MREGTMSITDKLRETKEKLKHKLEGQKETSAHEQRGKTEALAQKARDAVRTEAQHETSEGKRIGKDIREKVEGKPGEPKELFNKP
jgi:hypothetical protein